MIKAKKSLFRAVIFCLLALAVFVALRHPMAAHAAVAVSDKPDTPFKLATFTTAGKTRVGIVE